VQVERLPRRSHETGVEERQGVAANLHPLTGAFQARDDVVRIHGLHLLAADARPHAKQAVGRRRHKRAVVWDTGRREQLTRRNLEGDREHVEAREDVLSRRAARATDASEIVGVEIDQVEDSLLVELIGIVELAGDDASAVAQRMNEGVDEVLVVETDLAARTISRVVALEGAKAVDQTIGLRTVVIGKNSQVLADDDGVSLPGQTRA
jgi:hypothetical protein